MVGKQLLGAGQPDQTPTFNGACMGVCSSCDLHTPSGTPGSSYVFSECNHWWVFVFSAQKLRTYNKSNQADLCMVLRMKPPLIWPGRCELNRADSAIKNT